MDCNELTCRGWINQVHFSESLSKQRDTRMQLAKKTRTSGPRGIRTKLRRYRSIRSNLYSHVSEKGRAC